MVKRTYTQPSQAPKRQPTISTFHPPNNGGGQGRQDSFGKQSANHALEILKQKAQTANKSLGSGSKISKHSTNHVVGEPGLQKSRDARLSNKHPSSQSAKYHGVQTSHQLKAPKELTRQPATALHVQYEARLKASVAAQQPPLHKHSSSQRAQTQARVPYLPPSSSAFNAGQRYKEAHLARLAEEDEEEAWSDRNVAMYEKSMPALVVKPRHPHASTANPFLPPKPFVPREKPPPPTPPPTISHAKSRPSVPRSQAHTSILKHLHGEAKREKERKSRALRDLQADNVKEEFPEEEDRLLGVKINHQSWNPSAAAAASSAYRSTHHTNITPTTQTTTHSNGNAQQPLGHTTPSGSNTIPGIHPNSLPPVRNLDHKPDNEDASAPTTSQQPPKGPFSLNSAAGIQAIEKTLPPPPPRPMVLPYETTTSSS